VRILIVGAGVIGTVYGAKLVESGHEIVMLARGDRLIELRRHGLVLEDAEHRRRTALPVSVVDAVSPGDPYDLVLAPVRRDQLKSTVPVITKVFGDPNVLVFANAMGLCGELRAAIGERLLFGFPAAAGARDGAAVRYVLIRQQKTMLGEPDGRATSRVRDLRDALGHAGFPATISANPAGWLNAHTAFVVPIAYALYRVDTDAAKLAEDGPTVRQMVRATREAFRALLAAGEAAIPSNLAWLYLRMPESFAVRYWRRVFAGPRGELWFAAHSRAAPEEMASLATALLSMVRRSKHPAPDLDELLSVMSGPVPRADNGGD
jgi:2-dehydropantoate 2-reductase